ncbi:odorant receptor 2a-like [Chelonus insularis]|uniref:odorant receptor 2a-like n=1 Tax=Chelonus insularis TaxID=460826 RepID=UPI00158BAF94|nr:odorant receptor 2a-like [Chelonus insularis]
MEMVYRLEKDIFQPQDHKEKIIQQYYDRICRDSILFFIVLGSITIFLYTISHILLMKPPEVLPYRGAIPFDYSISYIYWIVAIEQIYAVIGAASVNAAFGAFFPSIMIQICAKIKILVHRFQITLSTLEHISSQKNLSPYEVSMIEQKLISKWLKNHLEILRLFEYAKSLFSTVVFIHYVITAFALCTIAYVLSNTDFHSVNFIGNFLFFIAMMSLQFLQCISANQVTEEFASLHNIIYDTNWYAVSNNVRRSMVIIMTQTLQPIIFSSGHFVTLSIESFKHVLKASYTIYNVLA